MDVNEKELNDKLLEMEYLRRELEDSVNVLSTLQYTQESIASSLLGLDSLKDGVKQVLVPYSSEIFFEGEIKNTSLPLVNIGSNIFKRMDLERLKTMLNERLKTVTDNVQDLLKNIDEMQSRSKKLEESISAMYEKYRDSQAK
ncbi:MAG: hypothetical protein OH316_00640 [Candidatus Parvarchaeota archaeon]|nr:hypothetical protein [Candidatus Parvarchaeota archaeon]MCW1301630.1 hypothetical protein [Candidatus Parvarchaeota archaeon]